MKRKSEQRGWGGCALPIAAILEAAILLVVVVAYWRTRVTCPECPLPRQRNLKGMSREEVFRRYGPPFQTHRDNSEWCYGGTERVLLIPSPVTVTLKFDKDGHVKEHDYDD